MEKEEMIDIEATDVRFFSTLDETLFFEWIKKITCVKNYEGRGQVLIIRVDSDRLDEDSVREFLALFHRYEIDMTQLIKFDRPEFSDWFRDKKAYWYKSIFK